MALKDYFNLGASDQTEDERKLAAHVRSKVEEVRATANRIAHEGLWMTNIAYCLGYDGITWNTNTKTFTPINRTTSYLRKDRIHVNKILPTIHNRLARLCKNPPKFDVKPESNNTEDKEAARLGQQVLMAMWDKLHILEKRIPLYMWVQQCGHAWIKVDWDESAGKEMVDPVSNDFMYEGDVRCEVVSPLEIFPDTAAKSYEEMLKTWVIQAKVRKLDYFKKQYPGKGDLVKEEDAWLLSVQYEQRINSLNARGPSSSGFMEAMKNSAIELIKYEARSKDYPNGRMIVCANGILLEDKELPCGEIPLVKFDDIVIGGKFNSESIVTHLRPVQDQYNTTIRKRAQWVNQLLAGKYIAAKGTALGQEALTDKSGEVVYYTPVPSAPNGGEPHPMVTPQIPQHAYLEEDRLNAIINDISGISEVSRGTLPSASIPAIGMQLLTEQDDTRIGVITEQHEHAWARVGHLILEYVQNYYDMPRKLKIAGKSLQYTVKEIKGEDLKGNTDVYVIRGSTLPGSKTLARTDIMNLFSSGLLGNPADPKVKENVLSMLEFGGTAEAWEDFALDMNQIKEGIAQMEQGIPFHVQELDNHPLWIQELNRYRKNDKFKSLSPAIQNMIMLQIEVHMQMMLRLTNQVPPDESELPQYPPPPPGVGGPPPGAGGPPPAMGPQ